jgi:hypothetical protein
MSRRDYIQCFGSGLDPDSIRAVDPDSKSRNPDTRGQKLPKIFFKKLGNFMCAGCSLLMAEGFYCSLEVHYGGLRISKLQFNYKKYKFLPL